MSDHRVVLQIKLDYFDVQAGFRKVYKYPKKITEEAFFSKGLTFFQSIQIL